MVAQGGRGHVHMTLDPAGGSAALPALDDKAENREPHRVAESTQLLGMAFQLGRHEVLLTNSN
jgi:hypothetical protein